MEILYIIFKTMLFFLKPKGSQVASPSHPLENRNVQDIYYKSQFGIMSV